MPISPPLTLAQATQTLQMALQNAVQMGRLDHEREGLRSLALETARIGAQEEAERNNNRQSGAVQPMAREVIRELLSHTDSQREAPLDAFLATAERPGDGFRPFKSIGGTRFAFYSKPADLGPPWSELIRDKWADGLGLVVFMNPVLDTCGMIFLHGAGKVGWSKIRGGAWQSAGGTTAFPHGKLGFADALKRVMNDGVAMTLKWRAVDHSLGMAKHRVMTSLGGSAGILFHGKGEEAKRRGMDVYAEVIRKLGITLTSGDEGVSPEWVSYLAKMAPKNIVGNPSSVYRGRDPRTLAEEGVYNAIKVSSDEMFGGTKSPVLVQGSGGGVSHLMEVLRRERYPVAGLVGGTVDRLVFSRKRGGPDALFFDKSRGRALPWQSIQMWMNGIKGMDGLPAVIASVPEAGIFSPNAGPYSVTFDVAASLILGGFRAVAGGADCQNALDLSGSPEPIAWILQAAGIFHAADFVVNQMREVAIVADAVQLPFRQSYDMAGHVGDNVRAEVYYAFRKGIPPYLYELRRYGHAWNQLIDSGRGAGGRFPTPQKF